MSSYARACSRYMEEKAAAAGAAEAAEAAEAEGAAEAEAVTAVEAEAPSTMMLALSALAAVAEHESFHCAAFHRTPHWVVLRLPPWRGSGWGGEHVCGRVRREHKAGG